MRDIQNIDLRIRDAGENEVVREEVDILNPEEAMDLVSLMVELTSAGKTLIIQPSRDNNATK